MGKGSYTASDWQRLKTSRKLDSSAGASQTFTATQVQNKYNSKYIGIRESCDSEDSPQSTPIMIGFDVTGSMGYLAQEIATKSLNEAIMQILSKKPVTDPHIMCCAITDPDDPLQATQYEADIRIIEQLLDFKLGGGNYYGYDNLLWYFAAKHTRIDSFEKRGKKGIIIGIGDEVARVDENILPAENIRNNFGDNVDADIKFYKAYEMAAEKYEIAHIVVGGPERFNDSGIESYTGWRDALPGRVAGLEAKDIGCLAEVIVAIIQMLNGVSKEAVLKDIPQDKLEVVKSAIKDFVPLTQTAPAPIAEKPAPVVEKPAPVVEKPAPEAKKSRNMTEEFLEKKRLAQEEKARTEQKKTKKSFWQRLFGK